MARRPTVARRHQPWADDVHKVFRDMDVRQMAYVPDPLRAIPIPKSKRKAMGSKIQSTFPGMQLRSTGDLGRSPDPNLYYTLRWETLGPYRDHPREKPWPDPSILILYTHQR